MNIVSVAPAKHAYFPVKDKHGRSSMAVVLKYTFAVDPRGGVTLVPRGADPDLVDTYNGEDASTSSIRRPSQLFDYKPGTDVLLLGHAHPPLRGNATSVDVKLSFGPVSKTVRAYGLRVWQKGALGGVAPGPARPLREPVPLIYELAYGGMDLEDPKRMIGEPRNYVGRGVTKDPSSLIGQPAVQLEDPSNPKLPASFGAIHRHWQPRMSFGGTYDASWMETKMPLLPDDFDPRFHVSVPPDQWSAAPLRGDEPVEIRGATLEGEWRFRLPRVTPGFSSIAFGKRTEHRTHLDTILIDADAGRVELTFRVAVPLPRKWELVDRILIFEKTVR